MRDGTELQLGTSPLDTDSDDDGVSDLDDLAPTDQAIAFTTASIPDGDLNADNQLDAGDGLLAARIVSDPSFGPPTAYHLAHGDVAPMGGAPNGIDVADELLILRGARGDDDVDGDGLTSALELQHGASPFRADTDGDGISDFDEVFPPPGTEPSEPGERDSDEDGLTDEEETTAGQDGMVTNPALPDTDGDAIPDGRDGTPLDGVVFYHGDHLGSTTVLTNHEGTELSRVLYKPFGEAFGGTPAKFGFTGQRFEAGLGIYDYRARFYDPGLGRFLSADSLVPQPFNPQSLNRYSYVSNDPLGQIDPSGNTSVSTAGWSFGVVDDPVLGQAYGVTISGYESIGEGYGQEFSSFYPLAPPTPRYGGPSPRQGLNPALLAEIQSLSPIEQEMLANALRAGQRSNGIGVGDVLAAAAVGAAIASPADGPVLDIAAIAAAGARAAKVAAALGIPLAITSDQGPKIPVFPVSRSITPNIAENVAAALATRRPAQLNRITDPRQIAANRRAALRGQPRPPPGFSLDEFPFASTRQGGAGARVAPVPIVEQAIQGGSLSSFFQANKIGPGDPFLVVVVP